MAVEVGGDMDIAGMGGKSIPNALCGLIIVFQQVIVEVALIVAKVLSVMLLNGPYGTP
ncbi:hypothetical protein NEOLEDRAFT_1141247 [Neolentinus lepideus HHB14362 ss-1]|uniref:Uncharacterized protein n=1 Tax=Neolentinus lepideus HHB14362 ss-1 TaxID=1314782 RepID=A0A165NSU2_9AGAM|nr:hypothetical protein NEOLEDRAFT_1141247 [Neolentinus lepideus HHB14362 ss-1]